MYTVKEGDAVNPEEKAGDTRSTPSPSPYAHLGNAGNVTELPVHMRVSRLDVDGLIHIRIYISISTDTSLHFLDYRIHPDTPEHSIH